MTLIPIERWGIACACAVLLGLAGAYGASAATVATGWRAGDHGATTRFVLDLDGPAPFKLLPETNPDRLRIDLPGVDWQFGHQAGGARPDGLIGAAEFSDPPGPGSHVTLWLRGPARVNSATLVPPSEGYRYRLVIDLEAGAAPRPAPPPAAAPPPPKPAPQAASPPPAPAPRPQAAALPPPKPAPVVSPAPAAQRAVAGPPPAAQAQPAPPPAVAPKEVPVAAAPAAPAPVAPPPIVASPGAAAATEPVAAPGPPLALRPARIALEFPPPPLPAPPPPAPPPAVGPSAQAAMLPPPLPRPRDETPPPPAAAPLPRITSTPLPLPLPSPPPAPPPMVLPATAQLAALPPVRIIREPGRPVMVILALPLPLPLPLPPKPAPPPPKAADTRPVIVLDPGHGGIDPGATGLSGVHEKAITLAFAEELRHQMEESGRYRVLLTRSDDSAVALRERVRIARAAHADLLLSIHADVLTNRTISGLSVYTESETASDRETEALAAKENKADVIAGIDLSGAAPELTSILIDLAQRETRNRSGLLAGELVQELANVVPLLPRTHRSAGFAVLTAPDVPSILLELGYLSNKADERGLTSPDQRARLAAAILRGIDRFFAGQPMLQRS